MKEGEIYTLGTWELCLRFLRTSLKSRLEIESSQEELLKVINATQRAFGQRALLHTPEGNLEGILQPSQFLGIYFIHHQGSRTARHIFSEENLQLEKEFPIYEFSAASLGCCFSLYDWENTKAKYSLCRAGVKK